MKKRCVGTTIRGIRTPIIKAGDDLVSITVNSLLDASINHNFKFSDKDIICLTEGIVAKAENNYASVDDIALDIKNKFKSDHIGVIFPIFSRNRFALCLKAVAKATKKITLMLSYPNDEVGNPILDKNLLKELKINPFADSFNEQEYYNNFKNFTHPFTGVDIVDYYKNIVLEENCELDIIFSNNSLDILKYTKDVLVANIHDRENTKRELIDKTNKLFLLSDILNKSINNSGYNSKYGILGSNVATDNSLKLFPENGEKVILEIQKEMKNKTGKDLEVMIYGDGAFKDPSFGIWELADPVVAPFYTKGLDVIKEEIKLKFIADNNYENSSGKTLEDNIRNEIKNKKIKEKDSKLSLGTTPRKTTDILGSLADLTSGSGDKGTPVVLIQGYFDDYASK